MTSIAYRRPLQGVLALVMPMVTLGLASVVAASPPQSRSPRREVEIPFDMPGYTVPTFPDRSFSITQYGAKPGGVTKNTQAINDAITACHQAGGGRVSVPAGVWLTGPIHLQSNVELHLDADAELRFSDRFADYLPVVYMQRGGTRCYNYSPLIYARNCTNIAVTGTGTLNGQGQVWWPWKRKQPGMTRLFEMGANQVPVEQRVFGTVADGVRTCFIQPIDCKNVLLEGFTLVNGPSWNIHPVTCENLTVRGVSVKTVGPNNDGIDPDSCRNVIIEDCLLDTGDDCICLKAGRNEDGWAVGKPCENVVVRRCRTKRGHGGIVVGSEMSAGVRNLLVHDCRFERTDRGIRIKSLPGRGGVVENLWFRDITMDRVDTAIHITLQYPDLKSDSGAIPLFRNIHIQNVTCENAETAVKMYGLPQGDYINGVTLQDVTVKSRRGLYVENVRNLRLSGVAINTATSPVMRLSDTRDAVIENCDCPDGTETFLQVVGAKTKNLQVLDIDLSRAHQGIKREPGVPADAVSH